MVYSRIAVAVVTLTGCSLLAKVTNTSAPASAPSVPRAPVPAAVADAKDQAKPAAENIKGLPAKVVERVRATYPADPDRPGTETDVRNKYFDALRMAGESFDAGWRAYEARLAIVKPAIAKAAEQEKAGKLSDARKSLEDVASRCTCRSASTTTSLDPSRSPRSSRSTRPTSRRGARCC